jgi:hypothetical protein
LENPFTDRKEVVPTMKRLWCWAMDETGRLMVSPFLCEKSSVCSALKYLLAFFNAEFAERDAELANKKG